MKKWIALGFAVIAAVLLLLLPNTPKKQYYHHQGHIFGTYYNIRYEGTEDLHEAIKQRLQEFDHSLSMFNNSSVISQINRNEEVQTDSLFEHMYYEAQAISQLSDGAFDITVAPLVNAWGFGTSQVKGERLEMQVPKCISPPCSIMHSRMARIMLGSLSLPICACAS
mgnify:CR=1 FL=1